jgi:hypothetical protein
MSNKNIRPFFAGGIEESFQLLCDLHAPAWFGTRIAPTISGTVIRAYASEFGDFWLDLEPTDGGNALPLSRITVGVPWPLQ